MNEDRKNRDKNLEEFKYLVDSRTHSDKERQKEKEAILLARERRFRNRSNYDKMTAKLLQLKYQMESYVDQQSCALKPRFQEFLMIYVDTLYDKRKKFADDIDINPITLSQVINSHRAPKDKFLVRLILHSEGAYKGLCTFEKELWPKVYYQDKVCEFLSASKDLTRKEAKHVKKKKFNF